MGTGSPNPNPNPDPDPSPNPNSNPNPDPNPNPNPNRYWETLYASTPAAWTRGRRLRHVIESWSEGDAPGMGTSSSPGVPG